MPLLPGLNPTPWRQALLAVAVSMLGACAAVGPDYVEPKIEVPDAWHMRIADQAAKGPEATLQTWLQYQHLYV